MPRLRPSSSVRLTVLLAVISVAGCNTRTEDSPGGAAPNTDLSGSIEIDGSSTVYPISEAAADAFAREYPRVNVTVGSSGTGGGFKRFTRGDTEISDASRPIAREEYETAKDAGVAFVEVPVAYDGLTIVVHPQNDWVDQLTVDELQAIFTEGGAESWDQVRAGWPQREIRIYAPGTDSGTFDYFREVVAGEDASLRSDMSTSEDDNVLVTGVSGAPEAIGFFGVAYYEENKAKLRAVPIVNPETGEAVLPTVENIEGGDYAPFSRPVFIYVNAEQLRRPDVRTFVNFYVENAPRLAAEVGYVALPAEIYEQAQDNIRNRRSGTHYLTEEGEKRSGPVTNVFVPGNLTSA